jgi:hypothetical protein
LLLYAMFGVGWVMAAVDATVRVFVARKWWFIPLVIAVWGMALFWGTLSLVFFSVAIGIFRDAIRKWWG